MAQKTKTIKGVSADSVKAALTGALKAAANAATPKAADKATDQKAAAKKAAPKAAAKPEPKAKAEPKANSFHIHVNKTGRVCFGSDAAERLGDTAHVAVAVDEKLKRVRLEPAKKEGEGTRPVQDGGGRPYISATRAFKPLGFDGSRAIDIEAKPYGQGGFEFKLA